MTSKNSVFSHIICVVCRPRYMIHWNKNGIKVCISCDNGCKVIKHHKMSLLRVLRSEIIFNNRCQNTKRVIWKAV